MPTWMIVALVLLVITSPAWGILLAGYLVYKVNDRRETRNCPVCQGDGSSLFLPDEWRTQFCWYHGYRHDKVVKLEQDVFGEYPNVEA